MQKKVLLVPTVLAPAWWYKYEYECCDFAALVLVLELFCHSHEPATPNPLLSVPASMLGRRSGGLDMSKRPFSPLRA